VTLLKFIDVSELPREYLDAGYEVPASALHLGHHPHELRLCGIVHATNSRAAPPPPPESSSPPRHSASMGDMARLAPAPPPRKALTRAQSDVHELDKPAPSLPPLAAAAMRRSSSTPDLRPGDVRPREVPGDGPEAKAEAKAEAKTEAKAEAKAEAKTEAKGDAGGWRNPLSRLWGRGGAASARQAHMGDENKFKYDRNKVSGGDGATGEVSHVLRLRA